MSKMFHNPEIKQINFLDERFYTADNINFFPSVTEVLNVFPKGFGYLTWLKDLGHNSDAVMERAGKTGTAVHDAINKYLIGLELLWADENGKTHYDFDEWVMILKFKEFMDNHKPEIEASETNFVSSKLKIGGTIDIVAVIDKKRWLIDVKTSNNIYTTHELQISAYAQLWNEAHPDKIIDETAILWLKAATRTEGKKGAIQGRGWQIKTFDRNYNEAYKIFEHTREIWNEMNPNYRPKNLTYPDRIKL